MVVGDLRKFVVALIVPNPVTVSARLAEDGLKFSLTPNWPPTRPLTPFIEKKVARLTTHLAQYETIKRFALLADDFTFDSGSLTFTMKLKRRVVEQQYADAIDKLYADVAEPRPVSNPRSGDLQSPLLSFLRLCRVCRPWRAALPNALLSKNISFCSPKTFSPKPIPPLEEVLPWAKAATASSSYLSSSVGVPTESPGSNRVTQSPPRRPAPTFTAQVKWPTERQGKILPLHLALRFRRHHLEDI